MCPVAPSGSCQRICYPAAPTLRVYPRDRIPAKNGHKKDQDLGGKARTEYGRACGHASHKLYYVNLRKGFPDPSQERPNMATKIHVPSGNSLLVGSLCCPL